MKYFWRTVTGKTLAFLACGLAACLLLACVGGIWVASEAGFYTETEEETVNRFTASYRISCGDDILRSYVKGAEPGTADYGNVTWCLTRSDGTVVAKSDGWTGTALNKLEIGVLHDEDGAVTDFFYHSDNEPIYEKAEYFTVLLGEKEGIPVADEYALVSRLCHSAYALRYWVFAIAFGALLLTLVFFINLMCTAARKPNTEELCPGPLNRVPFDVLTVLVILAAVGYIALCDTIEYTDTVIEMIMVAFGVVFCGAMALGLCISAASRIKQHNLIHGTLCCMTLRFCRRVLAGICKWIWTVLKGIPLVPKTAALLTVLFFVNLIAIGACYGTLDGGLFLLFLLEAAVVGGAALWFVMNLRTLEKGGKALAEGDLSYQVPVKNMFPSAKKHGENLNSIGVGMAAAVEKQLKSERMKTELITNVSHDIKTPLTSIINYADLIGREHSENETINEYSEVLLRQSQRLKRLIEDLVEASKASTGNLEVALAPCDAGVFLEQAAGEYGERLEQAGLSLVTQCPEQELRILADGRRMWRVFDNLMNNICKYAQSGTRVYLTLDRDRDNAVIIFRNTSREQLNMTEEELMERFTRGDSSRSTEGSGLGLSIARSLTELQNGKMRVFIDGDLFKVFLTFPLIGE